MTKEWLTAAEAAVLARRHPSRIYEWIRKGLLREHVAADGTVRVRAADVTRVEATVKRGRRKGTRA